MHFVLLFISFACHQEFGLELLVKHPPEGFNVGLSQQILPHLLHIIAGSDRQCCNSGKCHLMDREATTSGVGEKLNSSCDRELHSPKNVKATFTVRQVQDRPLQHPLAPSSGSLYSCNFRDRATQNPASHSFNINSPPVSSRLIPRESTGKKRRLLLRTGDMTTSQREIRLVLPHVVTALTELAELNPIKDTSCHDIALCISEVCMLGKIGAGSYDNYQGLILFPV